MAGYISDDTRKVTTHRLIEMKQRGEKISMLTSYDYTMAQIVDGAGIDVILVGDSASNVMAGNVTTLPITLDQMIYHGKSVVRGVKRAMVVVDMPFGSYQGNEMEGLASAIRIMKESHADALKLEGAIMKVVDEQLGAVARPARVRFVSVLPKTRSGKLLRRAIQAVCEGRDAGDLTTMEDPAALQQIKDSVQ